MIKHRTIATAQRLASAERLEGRQLLSAVSGLHATYFDNPDFTLPVASRIDANVSFNWGTGAPVVGVAADAFSIRWTGQIKAKYSEEYTFFVTADDGARLWINGQLVVDTWQPQGTLTRSGKITLQAGQMADIRLDYREDGGRAQVKLAWSSASQAKQTVPTTALYSVEEAALVTQPTTLPSATPRTTAPGLHAEYFSGLNNTKFAFARTDDQINFDWGAAAPSATMPADMFSVRWSGQVTAPVSGLYTFYTTSDDGIRVWIDGQLIINKWDNHPAQEDSGAITLAGGVAHDVSVEYFEGPGLSVARLEWMVPGAAREVIPAARFSHWETVAPTTLATLTPSAPATLPATNSTKSDRLVVWYSIGFSSNVAADRNVGWDIKKLGWAGFIDKYVKPQIAWGARRIVLGNPFGALGGEDMQLDQYIDARDAGLNWLTDGFAEAWRPITASGVEVIAYLGAIPNDPDFGGPPAQWQPRFWESINPVLDAGMNVAFDASSGAPVTSTTYAAVKLAEARGAKVYVEPRPNKNQPQWHGYPVISLDSFWKTSDPSVNSGALNWAATNEQLTGEVIRLITEPPAGSTWAQINQWLPAVTHSITASGNTVAFGALLSIPARFSLDDLVTTAP